MHRFSHIVLRLFLVGAAGSAGLLAARTTSASAATACGTSPFATVAADPAESAGAWVIDLRSGCEWGWNGSDHLFAEASVSKVSLMAMALQRVGSGIFTMTSVDRTIDAMITRSDNDAAVRLWNRLGGQAAVAGFHADLGLNETHIAGSFGASTTSPRDLAHLTAAVLGPASILPRDMRDYARDKMRSVIDEQAFGVTAGAPVGWRVAVKNGWWQIRPQDSGNAWHWRVNSTGMAFDPTGKPRWVLAVMGNEWDTMDTGVERIEAIATAVYGKLSNRTSRGATATPHL